MKLVFAVCLVLLLVSSVSTTTSPGAVFEREAIRIFVGADKVQVEGDYVFRNQSPSPQLQGLLYPFPVDSLHPYPSEIQIYYEGETVPFKKMGNGVAFRFEIPAQSKAKITVCYEQACFDNTACYILTSTSAWENPLEAATFEITVPKQIELKWIAYDIEETVEDPEKVIHKFSRKNFMPEKDLCLKWHCGQDKSGNND